VFLANTELNVPLIGENVSAIFFLDSGTIDTGRYRAAIGGGIQVMIPQVFGPVPMRFSIASPLNKDDDDETQSFSFFMGRLF
jgi:outer membrane protein assembly factor BamA